MADYGFSDIECKIICAQIERRAKYREEFLRRRTDPCKNSMEAGYVFDPALQRFMSLKATHFEFFQPNVKNAFFGICAVIIPMVTYGYAIWNERNEREQKIRCGQVRYRDRMFKLQ